MALGEFKDGERLAINAFRGGEDLPKEPASGPDDLAGEVYSRRSEAFDGSLNIFDAHGDMMQGLIAELLYPPRDNARLPTRIGIALVNK